MYDLHTTPFSRYGSFFALSLFDEGFFLRNVIDGFNPDVRIGRVELLRDGEVCTSEYYTAACELQLREPNGTGCLRIALPEPEICRLRSEGGIALKLSSERRLLVFQNGDGHWRIVDEEGNCKYLLCVICGSATMALQWDGKMCGGYSYTLEADASGVAELAIVEYESEVMNLPELPEYESALAAVEEQWHSFLDSMPQVAPEYAAARELAAYIDWSTVVRPAGVLERPSMYMSKNWMNRIWSWDNCFNAWAMNGAQDELAFDQLMGLFDLQHPSGVLPDCVTPNRALFSYVKPPIHGWAIRHMMRRNPALFTRERLEELYHPLVAMTNWWFEYRDSDGDGLPEYHHGNDSGWDCATVFMAAPPFVGPDLAAFLVLQMEVLGELASSLDRPDEAATWQRKSAELLELLIQRLWDGERFRVPNIRGEEAAGVDSLLPFRPIILGQRLPVAIREQLIAGLKEEGRFLTPWGLATESLKSEQFAEDGYWRGAIWAPTTLIIVDGLREAGEHEFAREIAKRFCDMCAEHGFAENYSALSGKGLRDCAYSWTASVFLILASEYM